MTTATTADPQRQADHSAARRGKRNTHRRLFIVDLALFLAFVLVVDVPLTGLAIHEWLGVFIGIATVVHLVQHGNWVATIGKRILASTTFMSRLNYVMMVLLFAAFATIVVSGLVISEVALPFLGVTPAAGDFWLWLHLSSVVATIWLTALHIAFNWKWSRNAIDRYVFVPAKRLVQRGSR